MSNKTTWIGIAASATAKVSVGYTLGSTVQHMHFYNCASPQSLQAACVVNGTMSGLALHAALGTSVGFVTGVAHKSQLNGLVSSGYDFAIDAGGKIGAAIKTGAKVPALLKAAMAYEKGVSFAVWLSSEAGKTAVNDMTGDFALGNGTPCFEIFSTPAGGGLGGGIWYENQTLRLCGTGLAWDNVAVNWRLVKHGESVWLQMRDIPEEDGEELEILGKQFHTLYPDGRIRLGQPNSRQFQNARFVVRGGAMYEIQDAAPLLGQPPKGGGINLSAREISQVDDFPYGSSDFIDMKSTMRLGFRVIKQRKTLWESGDATQVHFSHLAAQRWNAPPGTRRLDKREIQGWTQ